MFINVGDKAEEALEKGHIHIIGRLNETLKLQMQLNFTYLKNNKELECISPQKYFLQRESAGIKITLVLLN
jgi:hypothetical protein